MNWSTRFVMTTRTWILVVAATAIFLSTCLAIGRHVGAERRYAWALRVLQRQESYYREGRVPVDRLISASRQLMDAEKELSSSRGERLAAVRGHLTRTRQFLREEQIEFQNGVLHYSLADLAEAEAAVEEASSLLVSETNR